MYIARMLYPVHVLGPGERAVIWMCGCDKNCPSCANPELQIRDERYCIPLNTIKEMIESLPEGVQGFTITGGEPFDQSEELSELVKYMHKYTDDILIYSGYTYDELVCRRDSFTTEILNNIAALVDGRYIDELNNGNLIKGSDNQVLYIFNKKYEQEYRKLDGTAEIRPVENFVCAYSNIITAGFQKRDFREDFAERLKNKLK